MENYEQLKNQNENWKKISAGLLTTAIVLAGFSFREFLSPPFRPLDNWGGKQKNLTLEERVLPSDGVELPIVWGDLGKQMVDAGVIDASKFEALYVSRGGLSPEAKKLLYATDNGKLKITRENAPLVLNLLWAFGLANKSAVLDNGPMSNPRFNPDKLASTAGWTLSKGSTMSHLSMHGFVSLSDEMQDTVTNVAGFIYRPCCNNPTSFPDCNHGMAMLGLLELLSGAGIAEDEIYRLALQVNSYWFPENYETIASYMEKQGVLWEDVIAKDILGMAFSSNSGYARILSEVDNISSGGGSSCGA